MDTLHDNREYKFIRPSEIRPILRNNGLWYVDPIVQNLINEFILGGNDGDQNDVWKQTRRELVRLFAQALETDTIALGDSPEGFNDDDRWGGKYNTSEAHKKPDTMVIHHTSTKQDESIWTIEALGLLRLYVNIYQKGFNSKNGLLQPISSGHYRDGKQTFVGYHYLVYEDQVIQTLDTNYTGFHAGDYPTNCRSTGVAIVGDLTNTTPSEETINHIKALVQLHQPQHVLGHREVEFQGKPINTICPGNSWNEWKHTLVADI